MRALTSYLDAETADQADGDRTATALPVPPNLPTNGANTALYPGRVSFTTQELRTWVSEINLLSSGDSAFQWVVGAFYLDEKSPVSVLRDNRNTVDFVQSNSSIITELSNTSASVFGQVDYRFADILGPRFRRSLLGRHPALHAPRDSRTAASGLFPLHLGAGVDEVTGRFGLKYFAHEDMMVYGTVSKGYKAGGINLDPRLANYEPETNKMGELGIKSTVADDRLRINAALFYSDYDGIQLSSLTAIGTPPALLPNTLNAAPAEIYGAELELTGRFGATEFNLGVSALHSEFTEDALLTDSQTNTNRLVPEGSSIPFAPEMTATAGIQRDFRLGSWTLVPRIQVSYMDEQLSTPFPYVATTVPSRTVTDVRLTAIASEKLRLEAFATNISDETYIAAQVQNASSATGGIIYGAPRQIGVRAKFDF